MSAKSGSADAGASRPARPSEAARPDGRELAGRWLTRAGIALLGGGMICVVLGTQIAPLFLPGTWLLLIGFLAFAALGILHVLRKQGAA